MSRRWLVLAAAGLLYVVAVAGRTSLAVAVPQAGDRFTGSSSLLAVFAVLQLGVYALAQVPVGLLLDRFGSRRVLAAGAVVVALGQLWLATATSVPSAIGARVLVGAGDATAFIGALRLIPAWFSLGRVPLLTQATSMTGAMGQVVSAFPFLALLRARGWETAFTVLGGVGLVVAVLGLAIIRDSPRTADGRTQPATGREPVRRTLSALVREPGTWLGFFTHWLGMFPAAVFTLMWGLTWMTQGLGLATSTASWMLTLNTVVGILAGLVAGSASSRLPRRRSTVALVIAGVSLAAWTGALLIPVPLLDAVLVAAVLGFTGPFSSIGFDSARSFNEPQRWGTATGLVNMGGFTATIIGVEIIGLVLDARGGARTPEDFRLAFASLLLVWLVGVAGLVLARRATRRRMAAGAVVRY